MIKHLILLSVFATACASNTITKESAPATESAVIVKPECITKRAAFDIGSGETRLNVSKVDTCNHKIIATELELKEKVPYKESMGRGKYLAQGTMQAGFKVLQTMKKEAQKFSPDSYLAVATAAFREARNGETFITEVNKALKINAKIISQKEEGDIGYYAALASVKNPKKDFVVWDIGGSSQQIVAKDSSGNMVDYEGKLASVSFKDRVLSEIKNQKKKSPNPLTAKEMQDSIKLSQSFASTDVPAEIKSILSKPDVEVIGIGGVHYYSVLKQSKPASGTNVITREEVGATAIDLVDKDDSYFSDQKHVDTTITNVALVYGFMRGLNIQSLEIYNVNLSHGVLIHPNLWQK
ncbi:MAG: hypothetical protein KDD37_07690 [Bdellovibrionales bacterium]|nr:hypothetical protein [Bdellovibrionales bacterium]